MFAKLTSLLGGASLPYTVGESQGSCWGQWQHFAGKKNEDQSPVSIFKLVCTGPNDRQLASARNGIKRMKTLRHPNILMFKDSVEIEDRSGVSVYLITEPCRPLKETLLSLELPPQERDEFMAMGLRHICGAISFLNNDVKVVHGNLCLGSVAVSEGMEWKLWGMDLVTEHAQAAALESPISAAGWMVGSQYKSAEVARLDWPSIAAGPSWAVDAWGLGCLIQEIFSGQSLARTEDLRNTASIPPTLLPEYQKLLATNPAKRLNPSALISSSGGSAFFQNKVTVELVEFLDNMTIKDSAEREAYFRRLHTQIPKIPLPVAVNKILPATASALELGIAPAQALSALLQIGARMSSEEFDKRLLPAVIKLFSSQDRALRKALLESIDLFLPHLSAQILEDQVYPQVASGFTDQAPYLRELTLKSMVSLAPKLSQKTINNSLLKYLAKLQVDEEPSIRANTNILLGSIAPYMGEAACKRVLLNAFTRALKDSFPPSRTAALRALTATPQYYGADEVASRVVPSVAPLAVDADTETRVACLQCLNVMVKILQDNHEGVIRPPPSAPDASAAASSGYLSWALGSLGGSAAPTPAAAAPAPAARTTSGPASSSAPVSLPAPTPAASVKAPSSGMSLGGAAPTHAVNLQPAVSASDGDGWADEGDDDLLAMEPMEAPPADKRAQGLFAGVASSSASSAAHSSVTARAPAAPVPARPVAKPVDDLFSQLGMDAPAPTVSRAAKPGAMKLGAQKLNKPAAD